MDEEQLRAVATCPVCLGLFTQPVLTACGHSFCQQCLADLLGDPPRPAACPQCRARVEPGSERPNRTLGEVAERLKEMEAHPRCPQDGRPLELFCEQCAALLCELCRDGPEHLRHRVRPAEEAARELRETLQRNLLFLQEEKERLKGTLPDQKRDHLLKKVMTAMVRMGNTFEKPQRCLEQQQQQKILQAQLTKMFQELFDKSNEFESRVSERESLLDTVIAQIQEKRDQPAVKFLMDVGTILSSCEAAKAPIPNPVSLELQWSVAQLINKCQMFVGMVDEPEVNLLGEIDGKMEQVTLDPQTANLDLLVDHKTISFLGGKVTPRDTSKRFTGSPSVLGSQGFTSGRHYWEVNVGTGGSWAVGVALESVPREKCFSVLRSEKVWALRLDWDGQYTAECQFPFQVLVREKLQRIRVCLDYDRGHVTFYNADNMMQILQFAATFTEKVFPYFCLWSGETLIRVW